jgi:hypothetical protein
MIGLSLSEGVGTAEPLTNRRVFLAVGEVALAQNPKFVTSPQKRLKNLRVIYHVPEWSLAIGLWDDKRALLVRWNGTSERPLGNPVSRANPTWFILPRDLHKSTLQNIPDPNKSNANSWLDGNNDHLDWDELRI